MGDEKYPFDDLLRKTKDLARARRLDTDVTRGKAGVSVGALDAPNNQWGKTSQGQQAGYEDVNAFQKCGKCKGKGKG